MEKLFKRFNIFALCLCVYLSLSPSVRATVISGEATLLSQLTVANQVTDESDIPEYSSEPYSVINNNIPQFSDGDKTTVSFESYGSLDYLGRCTIAYANLSLDTMPTEKRGSISHIKPTGWHSVQYDFVDGKSLYNRCHLIGFQLSAENANRENLITGTRYMNTEGMLPFENMVADYIKETGNHVLYRVTPVFKDNNLVASGVQMEALSVEDDGEGICFNVFCHNVQPGVNINYATGESGIGQIQHSDGDGGRQISAARYILNTNTKKFHLPSCSSAFRISDKNREETDSLRDDIILRGYLPCGICKP